MKLILTLSMPDRATSKKVADAHCKESAESIVRDAITMVESGHPSKTEWLTLIKLNNELVRKYQRSTINQRELRMLKKLHKVLEHLAPDSPYEVLRVASLMHPQE